MDSKLDRSAIWVNSRNFMAALSKSWRFWCTLTVCLVRPQVTGFCEVHQAVEVQSEIRLVLPPLVWSRCARGL